MVSALNADLYNLVAHAHVRAVLDQLDDNNVDVDNTGLALGPRQAQADQGIQLLHDQLPFLGLF